MTPKSDQAITEQYDQFTARIRERLEMGRKVYGDTSFELPPPALVEEIRQEVLDVAGWAFVMYCRLQALEDRVTTSIL
jgi:hypothetical protein